MDKLRQRTAPITQAMEPVFLRKVLRTLFPIGEEEVEPSQLDEIPDWREEDRMTKEEISLAIKKMRNCKAPGPDGIMGSVIKLVSMELNELIAQLFTECFKKGCFPKQWKEASLVLLRKAGKPEDIP